MAGAVGEAGVHAVAAHSMPEGVDTVVPDSAVWKAEGGAATIEPGTRQATVTAASTTNSQCHLSATSPGYPCPYRGILRGPDLARPAVTAPPAPATPSPRAHD